MKLSEIVQKIEEIEEQLGKATNQQQYAALLQAQATFAVAYELGLSRQQRYSVA